MIPWIWPKALFGVIVIAWTAQAQWRPLPKSVKPILVKELPHDRQSFTQGLLLHRGRLFESEGLYGSSALRESDPATGKVIRRIALASKYFAEGLALQSGKLVQLTWKEGVAFRYGMDAWNSPQHLSYSGEGWGLTDWKDGYCMSNGSDTLLFRDRNFHVTRRMPVTLGGKPVSRLNELEAARGLIWANIWYSDTIVAVDPRGGGVSVILDASELVAKSGRNSRDEVLNGIAHDPVTDLFYLTGKNWPKLFVVRLP